MKKIRKRAESEEEKSGFEEQETGGAQFLESLAKECEREVLDENKELRSVSPERKEKQQKVAEMAKSGDPALRTEAMNIMINDVMPYIFSMVAKMFKKTNATVVDVPDIHQSVLTLICEDIERYDPNYSFLTFVKPKVIRAVQEATHDITGMTAYYNQKIRPINKAIAAFQAKGIFQPSPKDIHIHTGLPMKTIIESLKQEHASKEVRIDELPWDNLDSEVGDRISYSSYHKTPESMFLQMEQSRGIMGALNSLTELEQIVIRERLINLQPTSWRDLAEMTGEQPERLKQLHTNAIKKLRAHPEVAAIKKYDDRWSNAGINKREIPICPIEEGYALLNDLDIMDGVDSSQFEEKKPVVGIRN